MPKKTGEEELEAPTYPGPAPISREPKKGFLAGLRSKLGGPKTEPAVVGKDQQGKKTPAPKSTVPKEKQPEAKATEKPKPSVLSKLKGVLPSVPKVGAEAPTPSKAPAVAKPNVLDKLKISLKPRRELSKPPEVPKPSEHLASYGQEVDQINQELGKINRELAKKK